MICFIGLLITFIAIPQVTGWRGLVPLRSSRADVERLLGTPRRSKGVASTYDTKNERVLVFYSAGHCKESTSNEWNVARDTVITFTVHPNATLLIEDLKLDKAKYERVVDSHLPQVVYYFNKEEGVRISTRSLDHGAEDVDSITYEPKSGDSHLRCQRPIRKGLSSVGRGISFVSSTNTNSVTYSPHSMKDRSRVASLFNSQR